MAKQLMETVQFTPDTDKKQSRRTRASPKKRKQPTGRGRPRARMHACAGRYRNESDDDPEYDSDGDLIPSNYNLPTNSQEHDIIVLDCDDIFKGGPSVQITRNLAGANSCIEDDNTELQVSVRVNGKLDKYKMRQVCLC